MLRKFINSVKKIDTQLCEKVSTIEKKQLMKGIHDAESWCSEQDSEQINTLTEDNAVLAYRYYWSLVGALFLKDSTPKDIERIQQKANLKMPASISKSIEKLVNEDEELAKTIETKKRLAKMRFF